MAVKPGAPPKAEPFTIAIPQEDVDDLRDRLRRTRWADDFANDDWGYGFNGDYLKELVDYWVNDYDWRAQEAKLNEFPNYRVELEGYPIHFLHERGKGPNPIPIVLTHGWPWIPWDYRKVIGPLADPASHGGDPADSFDVIVPSLPGYGFSSPVRKPGATPLVTAGLWLRLMRDVLGYGRFAASGGDWGAVVTAYLAHAHADDLLGAHLTLPTLLSVGLAEWGPEDYGDDEEGWYERMVNERLPDIVSHVGVHVNDPQTLAWALNDSPVGLAAWILERRKNYADTRGDIESVYAKDDLCTLVSIYWFTRTIGTSMRFYADTLRPHGGRFPLVHDRAPTLEAPTAISVFLYELQLMPRKIAEQHANLAQWRVHERGGHYAAFEQPEPWIDDVRAFYRRFR